MPKIIAFDDAIARTNGKDRALLLGNGFSIEHFNYETLLQESGLADDDPTKRLFAALSTNDFEAVIRALEDAAVVENAYGNVTQSRTFTDDADRGRQALVHAVRKTHPAHRDDIAVVIPSCIQFLKLFVNIFTLNYDLLLYWVILDDPRSFQDGFGLGTELNGFLRPFKVEAYCNVYNLHGGLHLFKTAIGEVEKRLMGPTGIIDAIAETITRSKRLPIYVAEGRSVAKLGKINSILYLKHCREKLLSSRGNVFVYGHSANPTDAHIYLALFRSAIDHLYFCIHKTTADVHVIDGELARYKRLCRSRIDYTFVDAESARVWDR